MNKSWKQKFLTISIGQMASLIGSSAVQFSLIWWIASETGSPIMMGLSGLAAFLPATLLSPVAGIVADRYHRKYICILADLFIGFSAMVFAVLLWKYDMPVWTALVILFFRSVGNAFHQPAFQAMIPQFVPADKLVQAGGMESNACFRFLFTGAGARSRVVRLFSASGRFADRFDGSCYCKYYVGNCVYCANGKDST